MTIERESGIEFDFRAATDLKRHDKTVATGGEGNDIWKGVDFRVRDGNKWLWIEVKSWHPNWILPPKRRGGAQRSFVSKMRSKPFGLVMRSKFFATSAFLGWTGTFTPEDVTYVVVLEPPRAIDKALLGTFLQLRLSPAFPRNNPPWTHALDVKIVDVADWNILYPQFPARILP